MITIGGLDEALSESLFSGPLQVEEFDRKERVDLEPPPPPSPDEVPVVTVGTPRAWEVAPAEAVASGHTEGTPHVTSSERLLLLRMACSFRPKKTETTVAWARYTATLLPVAGGRAPVAIDMFPMTVEAERKVSRTLTLSPSLKVMEVEGSLGQASVAIEYPAVEPLISAGGIQEDVLSWDFAEAPGHAVQGGKLLLAVVVVPREATELEVGCAVEADLRHRGWRLPAWLGGSKEGLAASTRRAVAWRLGAAHA